MDDQQLADAFYPQKPQRLAADGWTNTDKLMPALREPIATALGMADPRAPSAAIEDRSVQLRAAAYEAGLNADELGLVVQRVTNQLRSPLSDEQITRQSMDTMLALRQAHRGQWDNTLKRAEQLLNEHPTLAKFVKGVRSDPAVAAMLVEKGQEAYMRRIAEDSRAGR